MGCGGGRVSAWETVCLGGRNRVVWTGKEEDERSEKRKGLDYCLLPSARTDEELGSLAVCDLLLTTKALHRIKNF